MPQDHPQTALNYLNLRLFQPVGLPIFGILTDVQICQNSEQINQSTFDRHEGEHINTYEFRKLQQTKG